MCNLLETEPPMQGQGSDIAGVYPGDEDVFAQDRRFGNKRFYQRTTYAARPLVCSHVDGVFHSKAVTRPRAEVAK